MVFYGCGEFYSEVQSSGALSREQSETFLGQASTFLTICAAEQIRLAPDKCKFELRLIVLTYSKLGLHCAAFLSEQSGRDAIV